MSTPRLCRERQRRRRGACASGSATRGGCDFRARYHLSRTSLDGVSYWDGKTATARRSPVGRLLREAGLADILFESALSVVLRILVPVIWRSA